MDAERNKLYDRANDFFDAQGSAVMKLTPSAAAEVCLAAARRGLVIARVEGGIWHNPGFEARGDCIWDGVDSPVDESTAERNNTEAAEFVREERNVHSGFVITAPPITGWLHRKA